jgi:cytochrome c biogenesis protein CcdA
LIDVLLSDLSNTIIANAWLAPLMALLAGVLTSMTPCALSSVPLIIGYVGGVGNKDPKKSFKLSLLFAFGMAITFTMLGVLASILGRLMGTSSSLWYLFLGTLMVLMALQTFGLYQLIPSTTLITKNKKKGYVGAFLAGILGGIFSSPCATPVLVVLLGIVARSGNPLWGIGLLLLYALGHSFLVIIAGTSIGWVSRITSNPKYGLYSNLLKYITGILILLIGFYMFYLGF